MKRSALLKTTAMVFALQGGIAAMSAAPALAQDDEASSGRDTIVVTARKKEESLLDAPIAVTALTGDQLDAAGLVDIVDLANVSPGLDIEEFGTISGRAESLPYIRGVATDANFFEPMRRLVGVFVDGIFVTGGTKALSTENLERVEVIKGPQSATFGRSTFSGAINYVTADPGDEMRGRISAKVATRGEQEISGFIEGPLGDLVSARVTGRYSSKDGHYNNAIVPGQRLGDEETYSFGGVLQFEPTENWKTRIRGYYSKIDDGPSATHLIDSRLSTTAPTGGGTRSYISGIIPVQNPFAPIAANTSDADFANVVRIIRDEELSTILVDDDPFDNGFGVEIDTFRTSLDSTYEFDNGVSITGIFGYSSEESVSWVDADSSDFAGLAYFSPLTFEDYTAELRISGTTFNDKLFWAISGNYYDAEFANTLTFIRSPSDTGGFAFGNGSATLRDAQNYGVAVQLGYDITDQLSISFDGRYNFDEIRQLNGYIPEGSLQPAAPGTDPAGSPGKFENFLPRVTLDYKPFDGSLVYFTYAEGNLPGGFNTQFAGLNATEQADVLAILPDASENFGEEKMINYELGWKQDIMNGRGSVAIAAFIMKRKDEVVNTLVEIPDADPMNLTGLQTVGLQANAQTSESKGIEFEGGIELFEGLDLYATFAYIDPEIVEAIGTSNNRDLTDFLGAGVTAVGRTVSRFAKTRGSFSATYTHPQSFDIFGEQANWYARADYFYTGKRFITLRNAAQTPSASVLNLRTGIRSDNKTIEVYATNLTDEDSPVAGNATFSLHEAASGFSDRGVILGLRDRRQFGGRVSIEF